jgi:prophage antirepressor-like protein
MTKHDSARDLPATLTFQNTELSIIDRDGVPWLTSADLARALGYSETGKISKLFNRYKDEFTDDMTDMPTLGTTGNLTRRVRIFNPRGCYLVAMLAKTPKAKQFRRWVLDVLEGLAQAPAAAPVSDMAASGERVAMINAAVNAVLERIEPVLIDISRATPQPLTRPDDPMPRLVEGHAVFKISGRLVIVDTRDYDLVRGDRAVVLRVEDGEFPRVVTVLGAPPIKSWFDRCMIYDSGVHWHIPVGAVLGRVVWEGA